MRATSNSSIKRSSPALKSSLSLGALILQASLLQRDEVDLQRGARMQNRFKRSFNHVRDLYIRLPGRESRNERNILPSDLGKTADGKGRKWSIPQLLKPR